MLAVYGSSYYAGEAAVTEHELGQGKVIHVGSAFSRQNMKHLFGYTGILEPFKEWIDAPETVETVMRTKEGKRYLFVLNFQSSEVEITLHKKATALYTGKTVQGRCTMSAYETAVFELCEE